jgi:ADP-ribose pyrophosphatase YjhB (NUDIX family)
MKDKKIKIKVPKTRRTWKIKPYTRIKPSDKIYDRRRQKAEDQELLAGAVDQSRLPRGKALGGTRFCPRCGGTLRRKKMDGQDRLICTACEFVFYQNPVPAVAVIIPQAERIVLVRRAEEPMLGHWCLPAGFMELDETPVQCAIREIKEETGLDIEVTQLFGVDKGGDDPRAQVVLIIFLAKRVGGELQAGDDASEAGLFGPRELPADIAFSTHRRAIAKFFGEMDEQDSGT